MFDYTRTQVKRLIKWLLMLDDTPHSIALGAAVGIFISFTPTFGLHMALVMGLSLVIRMNRTAGLAAAWLNNPLTVVPVFFFNYLIGALVMFHAPMTWGHFREVFAAAIVHETWYHNLGACLLAVGRVTLEIAIPLWVGSLIVATTLSVPTYFVVRRLAEKYQSRSGGSAATPAGGVPETPSPDDQLPSNDP